MSVQEPQAQVKYIQDDGRLTPEGMRLFLAWVAKMNDLERRIAALE
jgi:hypothetical protein